MLYKGKDKFIEQVKLTDGAKLIFEKNNVVLVRVTTFNACNRLFKKDSIKWCIAEDECHWKEYVEKEPLRRQYFIVDFNKIHDVNTIERNEALIGFTLGFDKVIAAHAKDDGNVVYHFNEILKEKGIYDEVYHEMNLYNRRLVAAMTAITVIAAIALCLVIALNH
jgi:hypothetical protein